MEWNETNSLSVLRAYTYTAYEYTAYMYYL